MASSESSETDCRLPKPFQLEWLVGFNSNVNILNLSVEPFTTLVAVSSGHVLSVYNENSRSVNHLIGGHVSDIHQLDCDASGRFLVSTSKDCCVVWKKPDGTGLPIAIRIIERPFGPNESIDVVSISSDAKYLIITGNIGKQTNLQFWIWSAGREDPDATYELPCQSFGRIRSIVFNPFVSSTRFAITMSKNVLFGTWCELTKSIKCVIPKVVGKKTFNMTTFTPSLVAVSVTENGQATIWSEDSGEYIQVKSVNVSGVALKQIDFVDGKLILLDNNGRIRFFDQHLKIVYLIDEEQSFYVKNFMFNLAPRSCRVFKHDEFELSSPETELIESEMLFDENLSRCMSVEQSPFLIRNCLVVTKEGQLKRWDFVNKCNEEIFIAQSPSVINSFDVNPKKNLLCGGCSDGRIFLYDYMERSTQKSVYLLENEGEVRKPVNFVLFTKCQRYIVVAIDNSIQIIDVILMTQTGKSIRPTEGNVCFMCWSGSGDLLAYYDSELKTVLLSMTLGGRGPRLEFIGKNRSHIDTITAMLFVGNNSERLVTYSKDYYFTEYDVPVSVHEGELHMLHRIRYDQMTKPLCAIQLVDKESSPAGIGPCILTCGSMFKFKYWHTKQMYRLKTVLGPVLDNSPVRILCILDADPDEDKRYAVFATEGNTIGLQLLPFTGNAFRHVGLQAHANQIIQLVPLPGGNTVMSLAKNEFSISIWSVNRMAVDRSYEQGGGALMPYVKALPGGRDGWLFREMQDLFYYMQILTTSLDCPEEHGVKDTIVVAEAPDYMRALGFFPSEYEVNNMLVELTDQRPNMAKHFKVSFGELLKMYINYKPVFGYPVEVLRRNIAYFCGVPKSDSQFSMGKESRKPNDRLTEDWILDRDQLLEVCCSHGEHMSRIEFARYLRLLLDDDESAPVGDEYLGRGKVDDRIADNMLSHLPEVFNLSDVLKNIFGLEIRDQELDAGIYADVLDPGELEDQLKNNFKSVSAENDNVMWED